MGNAHLSMFVDMQIIFILVWIEENKYVFPLCEVVMILYLEILNITASWIKISMI